MVCCPTGWECSGGRCILTTPPPTSSSTTSAPVNPCQEGEQIGPTPITQGQAEACNNGSLGPYGRGQVVVSNGIAYCCYGPCATNADCPQGKMCCGGVCCEDRTECFCYHYVGPFFFAKPVVGTPGYEAVLDDIEGGWWVEKQQQRQCNEGCSQENVIINDMVYTSFVSPETYSTCCNGVCGEFRRCQ